MAAECTSYTEYIVTPNIHMKAIVLAYTKASATDYITASTWGIKNVRFAIATDDTGGVYDPVTISSATITFAGTGSLTGSGIIFIVGSG